MKSLRLEIGLLGWGEIRRTIQFLKDQGYAIEMQESPGFLYRTFFIEGEDYPVGALAKVLVRLGIEDGGPL